MNKIRWAVAAFGAMIVIAGISRYDDEDFSMAQAATDRETVGCLTQQMTHDEKLRIAHFTVAHDRESQHAIYTDVLARCILRADQWDRRSLLVAGARQSLSTDTEFKQMLSANTP